MQNMRTDFPEPRKRVHGMRMAQLGSARRSMHGRLTAAQRTTLLIERCGSHAAFKLVTTNQDAAISACFVLN